MEEPLLKNHTNNLRYTNDEYYNSNHHSANYLKKKSKKTNKSKKTKNKETTITVPQYPGWHALHVAAYEGNIKLVKQLILDGAYVLAIDLWGKTPLHYARRRKNGALNDKVANLLIKNGANDLSPCDKLGRRPIDVYNQYN